MSKTKITISIDKENLSLIDNTKGLVSRSTYIDFILTQSLKDKISVGCKAQPTEVEDPACDTAT